MTRINTNVSSLVGRNNLATANASLSESLTRLSTGLRINTGKDDPAGLIASENLRSDITSIRRAISNTDRANQVIATADSALGQVSSLLNDIRGLVTESANAGALSDEQISANQLQVDSSLEALNRIAQTTTFQGRRLLDGSLDFLTTPGASASSLSNLQIDQANLGASGQVSVDVNVSTAATQATIEVGNLPDVTPTATASVTFDIETQAEVVSSGQATFDAITTDTIQSVSDITLGNGDVLTITAVEDGDADGAATYTIDVNDTNDASGTVTASYNDTTNVLTIDGDITGGITSDAVATAIAGVTDSSSNAVFTSSSDGTAAIVAGDIATIEGFTIGNTTSGAAAAQAETVILDIDSTGSDDLDISFAEASLGASAGATRVIGDATNGYTVQINTDNAGGVTINEVITALGTIDEVDSASVNGASAGTGATILNQFDALGVDELAAADTTLTGGTAQVIEQGTIDLTTELGVTGNIDIQFAEANLSGAGTNLVDEGVISGTQTYTLEIDDSIGVDLDTIAAGLAGIAEIGTAAVASGSDGSLTFNAAADTEPSTVNVVGAGASTSTNGIDADLVFELAGATGSEVLSFEAGTSLQLLVDGINAVSDATGVTAEANDTDDGIVFTSSDYGSSAYVDIDVIEEGDGGDFVTNLTSGGIAESTRVEGTDVIASVNGISATGDGNNLSINTATLDLSATVEADFVGTIEFDITGGGALFQLGPDVVSNQQARLGITSVNTAALGGVNGLLYQLGTGGDFDLSSDPTTAAAIVEEAIDQVTSLRGRLGAFQRTTLETNRNALNDTLSNLTEAESSIRDADFAEETASLTRSQILVQSGTRVLAIANQNPQNVLALLG